MGAVSPDSIAPGAMQTQALMAITPLRKTERSRVLLKQSSSLQLVGRIILVAILVLLAIWILRRFLPALAWAGVLAIATWPLRDWLTRKYMSEWSTAILLTFTVGILIVGPLV